VRWAHQRLQNTRTIHTDTQESWWARISEGTTMQIFVCPAKWKIFVVLFVFNSCSQRTDASKQQSSPFAKKRQKSLREETHTTKLYIFCLTSSSQGFHKKENNKTREKIFFQEKKKLLERKDALMHTREKDKQVTKHCFPIFWKCVPVEYIYTFYLIIYIF
jgi:hypothetical protein